MVEWPDWLPGLARMPDDEYLAGKLPRLRRPPEGIVVHSGETGPGVAEWSSQHRYSYHLAWSSHLGEIVQTCPLDLRAQHAGRWNDWVGIALPGPWHLDPRPAEQYAEFRRVLGILLAAMPCIRWWCRHSDLSSRKRDPGPGFTAEWVPELTWRGG